MVNGIISRTTTLRDDGGTLRAAPCGMTRFLFLYPAHAKPRAQKKHAKKSPRHHCKNLYFLLFSLYFLYTFIQLHTIDSDSDIDIENGNDIAVDVESESENVIVIDSVGAVDSVDNVDNF